MTKMEKFLPSFLSKKERFKKDALKFCTRFWEEQKRSAQFGFTKYNEDIIDAILYLLSDKKDKYEAEKDALWFYEGMQSASEEEFKQRFDQESNSSLLNDMLKKRDEILDKVIRLCDKLDENQKLKKYKSLKLALYTKVLLRPDFVSKKKNVYGKLILKGLVEQLYRDLRQKEKILEFRETLSQAWQKQWEEGKSEEKSKETVVAREQTINGILQLCKELNKEEILRRYGEEALSFYEDTWKVKHSQMRPPEGKELLRKMKQLASTIGDREREMSYHEAYQVSY